MIPSSGFYPWVRSLLFRLDPEHAHALTLNLLRLSGSLPPVAAVLQAIFRAPSVPVEVYGLKFSNPVGLAAGYDKDGLGWRGLACLGFGHIEIGTVTPRPQPGNPKPRLFRIPQEAALINRMGFPGLGAEFAAQRLRAKRPVGLVLGVNLGKNKDTPLEEAAQDYLALMRTFAPLADYLAINVSSPNTVGLRQLQARAHLETLLKELRQEKERQQAILKRRVSLLVKLAPDLTESELEDALGAIQAQGLDGVIATNTTISREGLRSPLGREAGGLSGQPLTARSTAVLKSIVQMTGGRLPVIAVGGIMSPGDAAEKLDAGAALVQIYTGLIYAGPGLVKHIVNHLKT